jgi:hypothetical protein
VGSTDRGRQATIFELVRAVWLLMHNHSQEIQKLTSYLFSREDLGDVIHIMAYICADLELNPDTKLLLDSDSFFERVKNDPFDPVDSVPKDIQKVCILFDSLSVFAWHSREQFILHELQTTATQLITETDVHQLPMKKPAVMCKPFMLVHRDYEKGKCLFDNISSLIVVPNFTFGCSPTSDYPETYDENDFLIIWENQLMGSGTAKIRLTWSGEEIPTRKVTQNWTTSESELWESDINKAVRFVVTYAMLLEAENSPVEVFEGSPNAPGGMKKSEKKVKPQDPSKFEWSVRRVYLTKQAQKYEKTITQTVNGPLDKNGKIIVGVRVRGHIRQQRCGKGLSETKSIYIEEHASRRWMGTAVKVQVL